MQLDTICGFLSQVAPLKLAESWDNVGLLVGRRDLAVQKIMTCLTISPPVVAEAIEHKVDLVVAHHPLPFQAIQRITSDTTTGKMLLDLIGNQIAIYSAHTAYDSAPDGINQQWCDFLSIAETKPLIEHRGEKSQDHPDAVKKTGKDPEIVGSGRYGRLPDQKKLRNLADLAASKMHGSPPRLVGDPDQIIQKVAFACGSGGSFLSSAIRCGCDALITGEATFHICLEAESRGIGLILLGHYSSERFAMETLAEKLSQEFPDLRVWASQAEKDPILGT